MLTLRIEELAHHVAASPGTLRLALSADLVEWRTRTLLARRRFEQSVAVTRVGAAGAAQAATVAVTAMIDSLTGWVETSAAAGAAGR